MEVDAELSILDTHRVGEVLAEGLGATVGAEVGGGHGAIGRGDGDDGTGLLLAHVGEEEVGEAEDGLAVDVEDVDLLFSGDEGAELLIAGIGEADVVDEDGDVQGGELLEELLVLGVVGGGEVEGDGLGLDLVLSLEIDAEVVQDVLSAGDGDDVEAALGELDAVGLADALRGTGDDSPVTSLAVFGLEVGLDEEVDTDPTENLEGEDSEDDGTDEDERLLDTLCANHVFFLQIFICVSLF